MKTCPVCKARCFDDMEICYGCMYRFGEGGGYALAGGGGPVEPRGLDPSPRRPIECDRGQSPEGSSTNAVPLASTMPSAAAKPAAASASPVRPEPAKATPRVFGAVDADDMEPLPSGGAAEVQPPTRGVAPDPSGIHSSEGEGPVRRDPAQKLPSPLVTASLGNGYRLVISLEPE